MSKLVRAITIVEILIVIVLIAILCIVVFPVIARSKEAAWTTHSISNLHQCGLAIQLYVESHGGIMSLPPHEEALKMLENAPLCDPQDSWRTGCQGELGRPMIGSYAYVRSVPLFETEDGWRWYQSVHDGNMLSMTLMISPHNSEKRARFAPGFGFSFKNPYPNPFLALKADGSVQVIRWNPDFNVTSGWDRLFLRQKNR